MALKNVNLPSKIQDLPTYDIKENDFYKDVF